jgi:tetratricopeptide (TPR) repeat protein
VYLYYKHLDDSTAQVERDFNLANEYYNNGDYVKAIAIYTEALQKYPDHYQFWNNRGEAKYQLGRFEEALADFQKSVEAMPNQNVNIRAYGNIEKTLHSIAKFGC